MIQATNWKDGTNLFDYIIVGGGTAGCVLANRLSERSENRVLLLESGGGDGARAIQMPGPLLNPNDKDLAKYDWGHCSRPEPNLGGRLLPCPGGKVLGGSSSINDMTYERGNGLDYEGWAAAGADGWSYGDVLPYFIRAETSSRGGGEYRGHRGPLHVSTGRLDNPLCRAFIDAALEAGHAPGEDVNGYRQEGFGPLDMMVHKGLRMNTARAYLKPALHRHNLEVGTGTVVSRILFEEGRAAGIEYHQGSSEYRVRVKRDLILAAGAVASPKLLMLSGVGHEGQLSALGIEPLYHLPGVGQNLQDHLELSVEQACSQPITLYGHLGPAARSMIAARWLLTRGGPGASNHLEAGGFVRSRPDAEWPDIRCRFLPLASSCDGHGYQVRVGPMRSGSRGRVWLESPDFRQPAAILFNYMSLADDWREMRACVRLGREIFSQNAMQPFCGGELLPGDGVRGDDEIDAFVRQTAQSAGHPCGTCRMGSDDLAVVDPQTRVHGLRGIRVVDGSIMPTITSGGQTAPVIMIAEKAADMILGRPPPEKSTAPFYKAEDIAAGRR